MSAKIQKKLAAQVYTDEPTPRSRPSGDPATLRGIPVVGVKGGKGGAIRGTTPGAELASSDEAA